jgi:hypothetical protein
MSAIQQLMISYSTASSPPPDEVTREVTDNFTVSATSSFTKTGALLGSAADDRLIFVCASGYNAMSSDGFDSVTIAGISATQASAVARTSDLGFHFSEIWWAAVPGGSTGNIDFVFTGDDIIASAVVYKVRGADTTTPIASQNTGSVASGNVTAALTISNETACLATACCGINSSDVDISWTNITEDLDLAIDFGGGIFLNNGFASRADTVGPGATTFTASATSSVDANKTMAAVEIAPAP